MNFFDLIQSFVERTAREEQPATLAREFQRALEQMGYRHYACCSHVNPLHPPPGSIVLHNYPSSWASEFCERRLWQVDPVLMFAERTLLPFSWETGHFLSTVSSAQRGILDEACAHGVARGYTIPIHLPWVPGAPRASCSVISDSESVDPRSHFAVQLMAGYLYGAATRQQEASPESDALPRLTARERQCLELAARGKSDWAIGQILGISKSAAHNTLERAKRRLGVATRLQAVLRAMQGGQISFGDVVRADRQQS